MELTLTPRLKTVADRVRPGAAMADVGTDHGYLPVRLLLDGTIPFAVASDLRAGPLARARETARRFGVEDRISFRLCDGLSGIRADEADSVAIAGMGGDTIATILAAAPWVREGKQLLLQPMTHGEALRGWLWENGFQIERELLAREGKRFYCVIEAGGGEMPPLSPAELWVGRQSEDPLRAPWLTHMASKISRILDGQLASQEPDEREIERLREILSGIGEMRKEL